MARINKLDWAYRTKHRLAWCVGLLLLLYSTKLCVAQNTNTEYLSFSVSENETIGTEVGSLRATKQSGFLLVTSDAAFQSYFDVGRLSSEGSIITTQELDHEDISLYDATVYDSNNGDYFRIEINVTDVNDNTPTFADDSLSLIISEASQVGAKFDIGSATDADSFPYNVQGYRIISGNAGNSFRLNSRHINGLVFADLIVNASLNRETMPFYAFVIEAFDGDTPPKTGFINVTVEISDINDNNPMFDMTRYTVTIREDSPVGSDVITLTATDRDIGANGEVTYRIDRTQSDPDNFFMVNSTSGRIYLNKKLDYEQAVEHKVVLEGVDKGSEPQVGSTVVIVSVGDINDNKPTINVIFLDAEQAKVSEAAQPGDYIARVSVSDPDLGEISQVNVTLQGGDERFGLQTENNVIYLVCVKKPLDREIQSSYHITLTAIDLESPSQTTSTSFTLIIEDVNDNPPLFPRELYEESLKEDVFPGTYVTQLQAHDIDIGLNAEITYRIETSPQSSWFSINSDSGLITTKQNLAYDVNPAPRLVIVATDKGEPPLSSNTTLVISITDAFDSAPKFTTSSYSASVFEDAPTGSCILQVRAVDPDSTSAVTYSFVTGSNLAPPTYFSVNSTTGDVCVTSPLDRETTANYELQVQATDGGGQWDRARVYVTVSDVNEFKPVFHPVTYLVNVDRNSDVGSPITQVTATDEDDPTLYGRITFNMTSGNGAGLFELDWLSGRLTVAKSLGGFGVGSMQHLTIVAIDGGGMTSNENARITISIVDRTSTGGPVFNASKYQFETSEDSPPSTWLGRVHAVVTDDGAVTYAIRHDPPLSNWFSVHPSTGDVTVASPMDREIFPSISFQVISSSGTPPMYGFASVTVTLNDVNDNAPHFYGSVRGKLDRVIVSYDTRVGSVISTIRALDDDAGLNGEVRYSLSSMYFNINDETGEIQVKSRLPRLFDDYTLIITARDLGVLSHVTTASLVIRVADPDVNCPVFPNSNYNFNVAEDFQLSRIFNTIHSTVSNASAKIAYHLQKDSDSFPFAIYPNGSMYLDAMLDRETQDSYQFKVTVEGFPIASSLYESCTSTTDVTITVDDVNDNPPQFTESIYTFHVVENMKRGATVGTVFSTDRDIGRNADVTYALSLHDARFAINSQTGVITTLSPLDHEASSDYKLIVEARDNLNLAQAIVHVIIGDVNDNSPIFIAGSLERLSVVSIDDVSNTWVADMRATDDDSNDNGRLVYSITSQSSSKFAIDVTSGTVVTSSSLNQDDIGIHSFVIQADDQGNPPRSSTTDLKVKVHGSSANPSQFSDNKFVFSPQEDAEPGIMLGSFDSDSSKRRRRSLTSYPAYRVVGGNDDDMFFVNETTGAVFLNRRLDYETTPQFTIMIEKRDPVSGDVTTLTGQLNIRDTNDHTPQFTSGWFSIGVEENIVSGKEVWRFTATDQDGGPDGEVAYSLVGESPAHAFVIDRNTGSLIVDGILDRESISEYLLVVNATDLSRTSPRFSTASCVVTIRDVNDNPPTFNSRDVTYVMEDEPIGYPLIRVTAEDADAGANGHVMYSLTSASSNGPGLSEDEEKSYFRMDSSTGAMTLMKSLDYERATTHTLNVSATDGSAQHGLTTHQILVIHVIDVNDVTPHFERVVYEADVLEEQGSGVIVSRVRAVDEDAGDNGRLTYNIQRSTETVNFTIDSDTGVITTTTSLDREEKSSYTFTVFVQDNSFPSLYDWCTVHVTVVDANDNSPQFTPLDVSSDPPVLVRLRIPENVEGQEIVHVVSSYDADAGENGRITYSIAGGDVGGDFNVNASTGELWISRQLDRETTASYRLEVVATDHGQPALSTAGIIEVDVLDWNDNDPQFTEDLYRANVSEGMTKGQYVITVRATDADEGLNSEVRYFLDPSQPGNELEGLFTVDPTTGVVTTSAILDRESKPRHIFSVMAVDSAPYGPRKSSVQVEVAVNDINDNYPLFEETLVRVNLSRTVTSGVSIAHVTCTDDDIGLNGYVIYSFSNDSNAGDVFTIDPLTGNIRTRLMQLPADFPWQYTIHVTASDKGTPPLLSQAAVVVSIVGEHSSVMSLQFDKSSYDVTMWEDVQQGYGVTDIEARVVGGSIGNDITYKFLFGNEDGKFAISDVGRITVVQPRLLDYEKQQRIQLFVSATTPGSAPSSVLSGFTTVNIQLQDDNDNTPKFSQDEYYTRVWEEQEPSYVMQVFASDLDSGNNGEIQFHIASGDLDSAFTVDSVTGFLHTSRRLDREIHDKYELIIFATDLGEVKNTGTCTVSVDVVDINDHSPVLIVPNNPLLISEDASIGKLVTTVKANDVDTKQNLTFYFASGVGNPGGFFSIDRHSGDIFLKKALDHEEVKNLSLTIDVSDGAKTDSASIDVIITDVNDWRPTFTQTSYNTKIDEVAPISTSVIRIHADDLDDGEYGRVSYRLVSIIPDRPMFVIEANTGVITTNQREPISPSSSVFTLEVEAYDHGNPPLSNSVSVRIQRTDVNNNAPSFTQRIYEGHVSESEPRGFSVINVTATDADYSARNKIIHYKIVAGNVGGAFKVRTNRGAGKQTLGEICIANQLDREEVSLFELTVSAYDSGEPRLSSNSTVRIRILDVNDNQPVFNQSHYYGKVIENDWESLPRKSKPVLSVCAEDPDTSMTSDFKFKIISGNDDDAFELTDREPPSAKCAQLHAKLVDYESKWRYELTIQVSDQRNSLLAKTATTRITVDVENVNEYRPKIVELFEQKSVPETTRANETLFHITANDKDMGRYGYITFNVTRNDRIGTHGANCPNPADMFAVHPVDGAVYATQDLDYETCEVFFFDVTACDPDRCSSSIPVEVEVVPVDEYPPLFVTNDQLAVEAEYKFLVPYGSPVGYIVGQVYATDQDSGIDGQIKFSLEENFAEFTQTNYVINETSGVIGLSRAINSGNARILTVTAASTSRKTTTHVTVQITGAPSIAPEAQVLSIVFGVIAGIACVIVIILAAKHCWNKRAYRHSGDGAEAAKANGNNDNDVSARSDPHSFYDIAQTQPQSRVSPIYGGAKVANGIYSNGAHKNGASIVGHASSGDFQLRMMKSGNNNSNGSAPSGSLTKYKQTNNNSFDNQGHKFSSAGNGIDANRMLRHRMQKAQEATHTGNDGSAEDEEVNRITWTSSSSGRQSSCTSLLSDKRQRVADSGIQQDIDRVSDDTSSTGPTAIPLHAESVESIHEFGDEGGSEDISDVAGMGHDDDDDDDGISGGGGEEMAPVIDSLGSDVRSPKSNLSGFLGSLDERQDRPERANEQQQQQDWIPEFQPLSSVFTEIARLREESAAVVRQATTQHDRTVPRIASATSVEPLSSLCERPPPLLTRMPQKSGTLAAPVPLSSSQSKAKRIVGHVPLKGLYPRPNPHYKPNQDHIIISPIGGGPPAGFPPSYALVMSKRPDSGGSGKCGHSLVSEYSHEGTSRTHPYTPSDASALSVSSLPRTPMSHESSLTSPAMSPSLSPCLTPLTTRSPPTCPLGKMIKPFASEHVTQQQQQIKPVGSSDKVVQPKSEEMNFTTVNNERMVHV